MTEDEDRARALALTPVSRETAARLDRFVAMLRERQRSFNLVAASTLDQVWTRHVADCFQLLPLAPNATRWLDLGSGAGFPGLVIACALADNPSARVHLVESTGKKAKFLAEAAHVLSLPALVHRQRIADFANVFSESVDVVTARALAPLPRLLEYAEPFLRNGVQGLFLKGEDVEKELTNASKYWKLETELIPSKTHPDARIVRVMHAKRMKP